MKWMINLLALLLTAIQPLSGLSLTLPGMLKGVTVHANVEKAAGIFTYSYSVTNSSASEGTIYSFDLDIKRPQEGIELPSQGLINGNGFLPGVSQDVKESLKSIP